MVNEVTANQWANKSPVIDPKRQYKTSQVAHSPEETREEVGSPADVVEIGNSMPNLSLYRKSNSGNIDASNVRSIKSKAEIAAENLRDLVEMLILKQGKSSVSTAVDKESFVTDEGAAEQAKSLISEDGYYGVQAVSDRIVNFAIATSGSDKTKLDEIKANIDKGFEEAEKAFGGKLADICYQTYDAIMKKLDQWSQEE